MEKWHPIIKSKLSIERLKIVSIALTRENFEQLARSMKIARCKQDLTEQRIKERINGRTRLVCRN